MTAAHSVAVTALAGDWAVARMLGDMPHPLTQVDVLAWIARGRGEQALAVELDGTPIGAVTTYASEAGSAEIGYWLGRGWWGRGYAREAVAAVIAHGFGNDALGTFTSGHFADNPGSARLLEACGFAGRTRTEVWCLARGVMVPAFCYRLERATWLSGYDADTMSARA